MSSTRHYVPATSGQIVYLITCPLGGPALARPEAEDVDVDVYPVLAWRITTIDYKVPVQDYERGEHIAPVLCEHLAEMDEGLWYPLPGGQLRRVTYADGPDVATDLDHAKRITLAEAQAAWDRKHRSEGEGAHA